MADPRSLVRDYVNDDLRPNYAGFVVIGAGLPRTGTMSLRAALGKLLDGACYHMMHVADGTQEDWDFWRRALAGKVKEDKEWVDFLQGRGYRAGVDYPIALFYRELMKAFPEAKVVLTVRDPETWHDSVKNTVYRWKAIHRDFACRTFMRMYGLYDMSEAVDGATGHVPTGWSKGVYDAIEEGRESSVKYFNDWTEEVKRTVPKERLLVFQAKQGWKPLCEFLGLPVPDGEFPRVNDTKQLQGLQQQAKRMSYLVVYGFPVMMAMLAYLLFNYYSV